MRERINASLKSAQARGVRLGRPDLPMNFRASPSLNDDWRLRAPTSRPSLDVTNGGRARKLPVASSLLISSR